MKKLEKIKISSNEKNVLSLEKQRKYNKLISKNIDNKDNIKTEFLLKPNRIRNPGIDLGRILAMLAIIIQHIFTHGKGRQKYGHYKKANFLFNSLYLNISTFIFISGYVGYKTTKYSNLLYLWLCTLFYSIGIIKYYSIYKPHIYKKQIELMDFFPVLTYKYWYFTTYFGMYLFLPVCNIGIENMNKSQMKIMIITLIGVYIVLKDYMIPNFDVFQMNGGYSVIWFLIFYSTGAYFGKFKENRGLIKKIVYNIIYIIIFYYTITYSCIELPKIPIKTNNPTYKDKLFNFLKYVLVPRINSLAIILETISLILFLTNINYNKYIAKIITFIGPLTFGVYLIHEHDIIRSNIIYHILNDCSSSLPENTAIKIILIKALKIFGICAIIDYLRNILFQICQIRKICILIEKLIFKILG